MSEILVLSFSHRCPEAKTHKYMCLNVFLDFLNRHTQTERHQHLHIHTPQVAQPKYVYSLAHWNRQEWMTHDYRRAACQPSAATASHRSMHTQVHTREHTLDWAQRLPSACVCMLAYCTRECVTLMCEREWMGVEMSLLIFGKYRRSGCYMLSGPTLL